MTLAETEKDLHTLSSLSSTRGALARAGVAVAKPLARVLRQGATQRVCQPRRRFTEDGKSPLGKRG